MNKQQKLEQALEQVGELKTTTEYTTHPVDYNDNGYWVENRPNGFVYYQFSEREINKAYRDDNGLEWSCDLDWSDKHIVKIENADGDVIWKK